MSTVNKFNQTIKKICRKLGENNKPTYVVMAIAAVKGICRPAFTMTDKTENSETKKYTAVREGLTEIVAIPTYWGCGEIAGKFARNLYKDKNLAKRAEKNLMFLGVCAAAVFVIPALSSVAIKPLMSKLGLKAPDEKNYKTPENIQEKFPQQLRYSTTPVLKNNAYASLNAFTNKQYTSLKIGGI